MSVKLPPSKVIPATQYPFLHYPFDMTLVFKQEGPDKSPYCDCNCGEYRQYVSGFFKDNDTGRRPVELRQHKLAWGKLLHPDLMQEDGDPDPYGHRYEDPARSKLKPNRDRNTDPQGVHDKYVLGRENGCTYEGYDAPGKVEVYDPSPESEIHFHLKFRAGAIDACNGDVEVGDWKTWEVKADRVPKPPPPSPPPKGAGGAGSGGGTFVPARPSSGTPTGRHPWIYLGGLPKDPKEFQNVKLKMAFESQGERYWTEINVEILVVSAMEVTVRTRNSEPLNIAPEGDPQILVRPYSTETILR